MRLNRRIKKFLGCIFALAMIGVTVWLIRQNPGPEHIEDTNGPDNYALQQITEADILTCEMGSRGWLAEQDKGVKLGIFDLGSGRQYSCKKFTGVCRMHYETILKGSDIYVSMSHFEVRSGNFAFYVLFEGQIVGQLVPDEFGYAEFRLDNVPQTGTVEYVIAGESANFRFRSPYELIAY